jgi:hypothetical protein
VKVPYDVHRLKVSRYLPQHNTRASSGASVVGVPQVAGQHKRNAHIETVEPKDLSVVVVNLVTDRAHRNTAFAPLQ